MSTRRYNQRQADADSVYEAIRFRLEDDCDDDCYQKELELTDYFEWEGGPLGVLTQRVVKRLFRLVSRIGIDSIRVLHLGMYATYKGYLALQSLVRTCSGLSELVVYNQPEVETLTSPISMAKKLMNRFGNRFQSLTLQQWTWPSYTLRMEHVRALARISQKIPDLRKIVVRGFSMAEPDTDVAVQLGLVVQRHPTVRMFEYINGPEWENASDEYGSRLLNSVAPGFRGLKAFSFVGVDVGNECVAALNYWIPLLPRLGGVFMHNSSYHYRNKTSTDPIRSTTERNFITNIRRNLRLTRVRLPNTLPDSMQRTAREYTRRNRVLKRLRSRYVPGWRQTGPAVAALLFCLDRTNQSLYLAEHAHAVSYIILRTSVNVIIAAA